MQGFAQSPLRTLVLAVALAGSAMCQSGNIIEPANQLQVTNMADIFQLKVTNLANVTQSLSYNWVNTGDSAIVSNTSNLIGGTSSLTVRGPSGSTLHQSDLMTNGTSVTLKGTSGTWQILFSFTKTDGNVTVGIIRAP
jgi:hypothetical protein